MSAPASPAPDDGSGETRASIPLGEERREDATSQGFHPRVEPALLRRSLILSATASGFGSMFFQIIQGTVFAFFLEGLSLRDRLPYFMALWCVGGLGSLAGSWLLRRSGNRKKVFFLCAGLSRIVWLAIGLIPLLKPEWATRDTAVVWLSVLILGFYFWHAIGAVAWMSWMGDLVPPELQGRYWSLRQVWTSFNGVAARVASGYYLALDKSPRAFAIVFGVTVVVGLIDAALFIPVAHHRAARMSDRTNILHEFMLRLRQPAFRRLCYVFILLNIANAIGNPTEFYLMRDTVFMGVQAISNVAALALVVICVFSLIWGRFSEAYGYRGPLVLCLLLMTVSQVVLFFTRAGDVDRMAVALTVEAMGQCGATIFMMPLLMRYARQQDGSREAGIAVFQTGLALTQCAVLLIADRHLYYAAGAVLNAPPYSTPVYMLIFAGVLALRAGGAFLAWTLPREANESTVRHILSDLSIANPLRNAVHSIEYFGRPQSGGIASPAGESDEKPGS
jgi:Na+/melibiose symporter-like transporter